jgi:adenylate cyclase
MAMKGLPKLTLGKLVPFAAVAVGALLFLFEPLPLQILRNAVFDQYQRWHPRPYQAVPVRIIDIDEESLKRLGQWPWPRTRLAELIDRVQEAGAAVIGFDVVFAERDRTSPQSMLATWNPPPDVRRRLESLPDHDEIMAQALRRGRVVLGFAVERAGSPARLPARPFRVVNAGESPLPFLHPFGSAVTSIPLLEGAAAGNGALTFIPDSDGVVRRVPLMVKLGDEAVPSLVSESLRVAQDQRNYILKTSPEKGVGLQEIRIGGATVPSTPKGELWVHYTRPVPERYIPAWKVLAGEVPAQQLAGHVLLVGTSAQGLMDLRFSPMGTIIPGVEAHAQALEQILTEKYLQRPAWAGAIEALIIVVGGALVGVVALATQALVSAGVIAVLLLAVGWGAWFAFTSQGLLLDPVTPALALLITFILGSVVHHMTSERQQRWVRDAFSRYVSPNRVDFLVNNPGQLELGGRRQECSFVFTDLAGFTGLMEKIDPNEAVSLLNAYLDKMVGIAFENGGTLDRIVGDAVAIMFSAPVMQPDHRARALKCALEMHAFATRYSADLAAKGAFLGKTRIGIHTGEVIVGNFGGSTMFDYRALGDAVNTAARLESVNKHLGTTVCVSAATLSGCSGTVARPVGHLVLKGKNEALMVYEPLVGEGGEALQRDIAYEAAYDLLQRQDPGAREAFERLAQERPQDPLVRLHLQRLHAGEHGDTIVLDEK